MEGHVNVSEHDKYSVNFVDKKENQLTILSLIHERIYKFNFYYLM